jgi:hypothetical protein
MRVDSLGADQFAEDARPRALAQIATPYSRYPPGRLQVLFEVRQRWTSSVDGSGGRAPSHAIFLVRDRFGRSDAVSGGPAVTRGDTRES